MVRTRDDKAVYFDKIKDLIASNNSVLLVNVDNVGSNQMHQIRKSLRGKGTLVMGKNTLVRRAIRMILADFPDYERLLPFIKGNTGLVFTSGDLKDVRTTLISDRVSAPAKAGAVAPNDVFIPPGNTGMPPEKTSFFQALNIPTKIQRGTIEIVSEIHILKPGEKVGTSEAALLNMLNISPFTYGMTVDLVFDQGQIFEPSVLDVDDEELVARFMSGVNAIASISLALDYPTLPSVMHSVVNAYKNILAVSIATDYTFPGSEQAKAYLENPEAFAAAAPAAAAASSSGAPAAAEEKKAEEEEESDDDMGFGLFD